MLLKSLLSNGETAIAATSTFIAMGMLQTQLDCTDVETLTETELKAFFCNIPQEWQWEDLLKAIDVNTLSTTLAQQLQSYISPSAQGVSPQNPQDNPTSDSKSFDIFSFREEIIEDYRQYIESFLKIRDARVEEFVKKELDQGYLWRDPLIQINPPYKRSATVNQLIEDNILHPECQKYFPNYHFYEHQKTAFAFAQKLLPYVVTTGTGSGKSLTYVVPIINDLLQNPQPSGVRAILVYPMNALINSQEQEFHKFLANVPNTHIRVAKYTGQESLEEKTKIQNNPPHVLLTNYVMLELMLTRIHEDSLVQSPNLKFLVLDELHTYRGRQGADVALVIRKLKQRCRKSLLCIGTSATMSSEGNRSDHRGTVAEVASKLFGVSINGDQVIDETLEKSIYRPYPTIAELKNCLTQGLPPQTAQRDNLFLEHPLSAWIEMNFGLREEEGHLVRRTPISLSMGAKMLAEETNFDESICKDILRQMFLWSRS